MRTRPAASYRLRKATSPAWLSVLTLLACNPPASANDAGGSLALVDQTIADTCAIRQLPIKRAVEIRPMTTFEGGYTKGIGSTVWEKHYADAWRDGWCAVGVYCKSQVETEGAGDASRDRPRGLYDHSANVLYVDTESDDYHSTVAHEFTHALQHQNYPMLNALHLWYNRDLAAAGNTVIEGGAHVVGWSFRRSRRMQLCMMAPDEGPTRRPRWWDWAPDDFKAHEMFPHAFGPAISLDVLAASGTRGLDAMLANPPLSTLAVLRPEQSGPVDFIRLPTAELGAALGGRNCEVGLRNTVGALGIWGLLRLHGDSPGDDLPHFIDDWVGDRFVHFSCPSENDDEFAWLTHWRSEAAAREFTRRWRGIAPALVEHGGVLEGVPTAHRRDRRVVVVTSGLADVLTELDTSKTRSIARYDDWIANDCFPQETCYNPDRTSNDSDQREPGSIGSCAANTPAPPAFADWLARVRRARDPSAQRIANATSLAEEAGRLGVFCATNTVGNTDLKTACRASYGGVGYLTRLDADPDWKLLPGCLGSQDARAWLESAYYGDEPRPFASTAIVPATYGVALAVRALETDGTAGLRELLGAPPLSTLAVLRPDLSTPVDFIQIPRAELAERGCRVDATDSLGVLGIWNLLIDHGEAPEEDALPSFLLGWRGDRQLFIRCAGNGSDAVDGWVWMSRWGSPAAAEAFAAHYRALAVTAADETGISASARVEVDHDTAWIVPPALETLSGILKDGVTTRTYTDFREWTADGCFPRPDCR